MSPQIRKESIPNERSLMNDLKYLGRDDRRRLHVGVGSAGA